MDDVRLALRRLRKRLATTLASVATLACAIGAAAVTWSALSAVLIDPLPIADPDRLIIVGQRYEGTRQPANVSTSFVYPKFHQIRESGVFEQAVAQWGYPHLLLVKADDMPMRANAAFATHDFFDVLGIRPALGREFLPHDDVRGASVVAVLTDRYWRSAFGADRSIVGRSIGIGDSSVTIVGVLPRRFRGLSLSMSFDVYLPFHTIADLGSEHTNYFADASHGSSPTAGTMILGRLRPDRSVAEAASRIAALDPPPPAGRPGSTIVLLDANTASVPAAARAGMVRFSRLLAVTVGLLLLIGCTTVGMLLLIRTEARREEFATCMALGASRGRLARGIAIEGALLAAAGALFALPTAWWLFRLVRVFRLPGNVSIEVLELSLDARVVAAVAGAAAAAVLLIAVVAGVFGFRADVADALRSKAGVTPRITRRGTRAGLVIAQLAVTLALLAGAGVFARSLMAALSLNANIDMSRVVTGSVSLAPHGYTPERTSEFFGALRARLRRHPQVQSVSVSNREGGMSPGGKIVIDGIARQFPSMVWYMRVDEHYFRTMGIRLLHGREFAIDDRAQSQKVAIVSESLGRLLSDGGSPLGRRIQETFNLAGQPPDVLPVVGVVSDVVTDVNVLEPLVIYKPASQGRPAPSRDLTARAAADPASAKGALTSAVRELDPAVTPPALSTLEEQIERQMGSQKFGATVLGALGIVAILLSLLGTYVLADSMASMRMREMGIRAALGATRAQLGLLVIAETARLASLGLAAGLGLAWLGATTIRAFLYQVKPLDPASLGPIALLILVLAVSVSLGAALRVARVDLAQVLRAE
jgi:predicted permease